jgi:hypothetical protein
MYRPLIPCPGCARHVLASERACPFCAAAMPADFTARVRPEVKARMSRSAMAALGAAIALSACSSTVVGGDGSVTADTAADAPFADATPDQPRPDAPAPDVPRADVVADDGSPLAMYGTPPPVDAGPDDDGGGVAEYGGPPPMDAGNHNLYGAPPRDASADGDASADASNKGGDGDFPVMPLYGAPPIDAMV